MVGQIVGQRVTKCLVKFGDTFFEKKHMSINGHPTNLHSIIFCKNRTIYLFIIQEHQILTIKQLFFEKNIVFLQNNHKKDIHEKKKLQKLGLISPSYDVHNKYSCAKI